MRDFAIILAGEETNFFFRHILVSIDIRRVHQRRRQKIYIFRGLRPIL